LRRRHPSLTAYRFLGIVPGRGLPDVRWHGAKLGEPGWHDPDGGLLGFKLTGGHDEEDLHVILNTMDAAKPRRSPMRRAATARAHVGLSYSKLAGNCRRRECQ
jgi:isoamylase